MTEHWQTTYVLKQFEIALNKAKETNSKTIYVNTSGGEEVINTKWFSYQHYDNEAIDKARETIKKKGFKCLVDERDWSCDPITLIFENKPLHPLAFWMKSSFNRVLRWFTFK